MFDRVKRSTRRWSREPDLVVASLGLLVGLALLPLLVVVSDVLVGSLPVVLVIGCLVYLLARADGPPEYGDSALDRIPLEGLQVMATLTFVGIAAMAVVAVLTGGRTLPFFGIAALTASVLFAQILFGVTNQLRPGVILVEVIVFSLVLRFAGLLLTPGLMGVDAWTHVTDYAAGIQQADGLAPIADEKYFAAPLYHVVVVTVADALEIPLRAALYASIGIVVPIGTLFVYAAGRYLLPVRWALFAVAAFAVADHVVRWGLHLIPTSLGLVFFAGVCYGVIRALVAGGSPRIYALTAGFGFATILTHHLSAFVLLVVLGSAAAGVLFARWELLPYDVAAGLGVPALFVVYLLAAVADWAVTPARVGTFLTTMPRVLSEQILETARFLNLVSGPPASAPADVAASTIPMAVALLDNVGFLVFVLAAVVGTLALLRRGTADAARLFVVGALVVTGTFTLVLPLFGVTAFIPGRWYAFMYVPMALVAAVGAWYVARFVPRSIAIAALVLFAAAFPAGMLVAHKATLDGPIAEAEYSRFAYDEAELAAVETIGATLPDSAGPLVTDHPYRTVFVRTGAYDAEPLSLSEGPPRTYLYREYQQTGAPTALIEGVPVTVSIAPGEYCGPDRSRVYDNGDVTLCTAG